MAGELAGGESGFRSVTRCKTDVLKLCASKRLSLLFLYIRSARVHSAITTR